MFYKKSIVLSGVKNASQRAVLTVECDGKMAKGKLRLYNFGAEPKGIISLGLYQGGKVVKAGLIRSSQMLYTFACEVDKLSEDFSCAVINFVEGEPSPILYGKVEGFIDSDEVLDKVIEKLKDSKNVSEVEETLDNFGIDYEDDLKEEIEQKIDECMSKEDNVEVASCQTKNEDCKNCDECVYKKFYLEQMSSKELAVSSLEEEKQEEIIEKNEDALKKNFYFELKPQIEKLFADNPNEDYLEKLVPNSKWVKVSIDENGNYYVLGLIYEEEKLVYICYGVPGVYQKNAPRELSGYPIWFPLEESKPQGFGYWLSYQDAENGESVKAVIV